MKKKYPGEKSGNRPVDEDLVVPTKEMTSAALARLIEEVRNSDGPILTNYNRTYHRHNR